MLLLLVARILRGEFPAGVSATCFFSVSYIDDNLSGLSSTFKPCGFVRLKVGGGSFSWSLAEGKLGKDGTLKAGCSLALDDLEDWSDDAGVDLDWDP